MKECNSLGSTHFMTKKKKQDMYYSFCCNMPTLHTEEENLSDGGMDIVICVVLAHHILCESGDVYCGSVRLLPHQTSQFRRPDHIKFNDAVRGVAHVIGHGL